MGLPLVLIHFRLGFSMKSSTNSSVGISWHGGLQMRQFYMAPGLAATLEGSIQYIYIYIHTCIYIIQSYTYIYIDIVLYIHMQIHIHIHMIQHIYIYTFLYMCTTVSSP